MCTMYTWEGLPRERTSRRELQLAAWGAAEAMIFSKSKETEVNLSRVGKSGMKDV